MTKLKHIIIISLAASANSFGNLEIHTSVELLTPTESNTTYQTQTSSNMVDWVDAGSPFNGNGETNSHFFSTIGKPNEFYRVEETSPASLIEIDALSYLNPFGFWRYDWYDEGTNTVANWHVGSLGTTNKNGYPIILLQEYDEYGLPNDQRFISTDFSTMCLEVGGNDSGGSDYYWGEPIPFLLKQFTPSLSYTYPGNYRSDLGDFDYSLQLNIESVTVPYGTYDSIKATLTVDILPPSPDAGTHVFTEWYVKNIGLVKRLQEDGSLWELNYYGSEPPSP